MTCEEALILISGQIDGENTQEKAQQLQDHLERCSRCRELLNEFLAVDQALGEMTEEPSADFTEKVLSVVQKECAQTPGKRRLWSTLAVAAAVALVIGLGAERLPLSVEQPVPAAQTARIVAAPAVTDPEILAAERQTQVVVLIECVPELEGCGNEILEDGALLYCLPHGDLAAAISETYDLELYGTEMDTAVSYALLP